MNRLRNKAPGATGATLGGDKRAAGPFAQILRRVRLAAWILVPAAALWLSCGRKGEPVQSADLLAKVGDRDITVEEFLGRLRYALASAEMEKLAAPEVRRQYLDALIDEKLAALAARSRGLDSVANLTPVLEEVRDQAMLRELYLARVRDRATVSEAELRQALERVRTELSVGFFRAASEEEARWVRQKLLEGKSFAEIATERYGRSYEEEQFHRTLRWGETDPALEEVAYSLSVGEVSAPVRVNGGFYVLKLLARRDSGVQDTPDLRQRIERRLRHRKEAQLARQFLREVLDRNPVDVNGEVLTELTRALTRELAGESFPTEITPDLLDSLASRLACADSVLFRLADTSWTIRRTLQRLARRGHELRIDSLGAVGAELTRAVLQLAQDQALLREAHRLQLEDHPRVKRDVAVWEDHLLAQILRRRLGDPTRLRALVDSLRHEVPIVVLETKLAALDLGSGPRPSPSAWATSALAFPPWPAD